MGMDPSKLTLTRAQRKSAIIGTLLGDANLLRQKYGPTGKLSHAQLRFTHSAKQLEYLEFKRGIVQPMFDYPLPIRSKDGRIGGKSYPIVTMQTRANPQLTQLHHLLYDPDTGRKRVLAETLERLDDLGVALWYLDDGNWSPQHRDGKGGGEVRLFTLGYTLAENELMRDWFADRYGVQFNIGNRGKGYFLRRGISDAYKLLDAIAPYVPESMRYKVTYQPPKRPGGWYTLRNTVPATLSAETQRVKI